MVAWLWYGIADITNAPFPVIACLLYYGSIERTRNES